MWGWLVGSGLPQEADCLGEKLILILWVLALRLRYSSSISVWSGVAGVPGDPEGLLDTPGLVVRVLEGGKLTPADPLNRNQTLKVWFLLVVS